MNSENDSVFFKIIIPNYNNMPYVKKCLDSILNQTFQDFKIIIVDDLSTDLSDKFCEMYARKYPDKIIYCHLSKKGYAGECRNVGLEHSINSEYTYFIDSDDYLYDINSLSHLHDVAIKNKKPDLIRCQYNEITFENECIKKNSKCPTIEQLPKLNSGPSCNCIKTSSLGSIKFQCNLYRNNDVLWFLRICDEVKTIAMTSQPIFTYNRTNAISCQNSKVNSDIKIKADDCIIKTLKNISFKRHEVNQRKEIYINEISSRSLRTKAFDKNISVDQMMENSFVISFDSSKTDKMKKIFQYSGLSMPKIFPASHNKDLSGPYNCILSHVSIVRMAKALNFPFVVIFEDDAYPCKFISSKLKDILMNIPSDASLVLLGWANEAKPYGTQKFDQKFNRISKIFSGSHAYIIFNDGYDNYLKSYQSNSNFTADGIFSSIKGSYVLDKPLFIQYSKSSSMNKHHGYIFYGDHETPPEGFEEIEKMNI